MSTVNIVMATYNGEKYIREQIDSILASTYTDWFLAVYDDASTDSTVSIIEEYVTRYPERIKLYKNEKNRGSNMNFLEGLKELYEHFGRIGGSNSSDRGYSSNRAKYFMFCDQDDVWLKDKIEMSLSKITQLEKKYGKNVPALVYTDAVVVDKNLHFQRKSFHKMSKLNCRHNDLAHILMENKCMGCTAIMNAALVGKLSEFPKEIRYHDWWMMLLAASFGHVRYCSDQGLLYRQHGDNQVGGEGFGSYCADRAGKLMSQKEALRKNYEQARAFLKLYEEQLCSEETKTLTQFTLLENKRFFSKRISILKHGYLKSGLIRNLGLMLIV